MSSRHKPEPEHGPSHQQRTSPLWSCWTSWSSAPGPGFSPGPLSAPWFRLFSRTAMVELETNPGVFSETRVEGYCFRGSDVIDDV